jgi:hypothetical protein
LVCSSGDAPKAKTIYQDLMTLWKDRRRLVGAGGMSEVYRSRDTPSSIATWRSRFLHEGWIADCDHLARLQA